MRFSKSIFAISVIMALSLSGCTLLVNDNQSAAGSPDLQAFQKSFMATYDVMAGDTQTSGRALTPFNSVASNGSRATAPMAGPTKIALPNPTAVNGSQTNYPEPGQNSTWVISLYAGAGANTVALPYPSNLGSNIYRVDVTTTFPAYDPRSSQVESYLIRANDYANPTFWTTAYSTVDNSGNYSSTYRLQNHLIYRDGSYQDEVITTVPAPANGYAAFDINGTLDYPSIFMPYVDATATYSSVVAYTRVFTNSPSYSFWSGNVATSIVGIRYYTEHTSASQVQADMVVFEKAVMQYTTVAGNFVQAASTLFLPGLAASPTPTMLSQSFLRQRIVYGRNADTTTNYASAARDTRIKTLVVDISSQKDIYITKLNSQGSTLTTTTINPSTTTLFIPSGDATEVLASTPAAAADTKATNTTYAAGGAAPVQITSNSMSATDLGNLWVSLDTGVSTKAISTDVAGDLTGTTDVKTFSGSQGITVPYGSLPAGYAALNDVHQKGTVQAWVYINAQANTPGIVHAGTQSDFSDEVWSLQFMGSSGQLAFSMSTNSGTIGDVSKYTYDWVGSTINLNTKKWYYVVATWDLSLGATNSYMNLYINGVLNKTSKFTNCVKPTAVFGVVKPAIIVGSQFYDATKVLSGYYGFNGKINGVLVDNTVWTAGQILTEYTTYSGNTSGW